MALFSATIEIAAAPEIVWCVMADVEKWPEWTASVTRVKLLTPGPLRIGSRVRIHQPKLPPAFWRITELMPDSHFTWISRAPGIHVTARHVIEPVPAGSRVTLSISYEGWVGRLLARWTRGLNERYLALEANGLKARCAGLGHSTNSVGVVK